MFEMEAAEKFQLLIMASSWMQTLESAAEVGWRENHWWPGDQEIESPECWKHWSVDTGITKNRGRSSEERGIETHVRP